jgi:hypothetical protein
MLKLQQLVSITSAGVAHAAARLHVRGVQRTADASLTRYSSGFVGASKKLRKASISVNDESKYVQVACTCSYFHKRLAVSLAAHKAIIPGTPIDLGGKPTRRIRPSLCAHLYRLALIVSSPTALKRLEKTSKTSTKVSTKLKGL